MLERNRCFLPRLTYHRTSCKKYSHQWQGIQSRWEQRQVELLEQRQAEQLEQRQEGQSQPELAVVVEGIHSRRLVRIHCSLRWIPTCQPCLIHHHIQYIQCSSLVMVVQLARYRIHYRNIDIHLQN